MKRAVLAVGVAVFLAAPAAAQWLGQPVWNSPMGGTGITIYGDYGKPNTDAGQGSAVGGRVALASGSVTLTVGVASWKPEAFSSRVMSYGGTMAARLIGGTLLPVAVNLQLGGAYNPKVTSGTLAPAQPQTTTAEGAVGFSVVLPTPGITIEPYVSPGLRYHKYWNLGTLTDHDTDFGWVVGGNLSFGPVGVHLAYDSERFRGTTRDVFGVGANVAIRVPLGM